MANQTRRDAYDFAMRARAGSIGSHPSSIYLETLKLQLLDWIASVDNELARVYKEESTEE